MKVNMRKSAGFTLVELLIVIVLIAIMSLVAVPRLLGKSQFSALSAKHQAAEVVRQIQIGRMQSNIQGTLPEQFQLRVTSDCIGSVSACNLNRSERSTRSDVMAIDDAVVVSPSNITIAFDLLGRPFLNDTNTAVTIAFQSANDATELCINVEGYIDEEC